MLDTYGKGFDYVDLFCGGLSSAYRVSQVCEPRSVLLNDVCRPLMLMYERCMSEGVDWLPDDPDEVSELFPRYKENQDMDDPLTAWLGIGCSYSGMWFEKCLGTRNDGYVYAKGCKNSLRRKIDQLRGSRITCLDYRDVPIEDGSVVYMDPPYEGTRSRYLHLEMDYDEFWDYARELSDRCRVVVSCFRYPEDFRQVVCFGDTISLSDRFGRTHTGTDEYLVTKC